MVLALCSVLATEAAAENRIGLESDVIGWGTGGYHVSAWFGTEHIRVRAVKALFYTPSFLLPDGFDKLENDAWEFFLDVAWQPRNGRFSGIWSSVGLELYDLSSDPSQMNSLLHYPESPRDAVLAPWLDLLVTCAGPSCQQSEDAQGP